ncbi:MAG: cell surface protein SprA [Bacteroidia bacterium]|nr:cell surface protein SprA [Bacteroidia bacterium]
MSKFSIAWLVSALMSFFAADPLPYPDTLPADLPPQAQPPSPDPVWIMDEDTPRVVNTPTNRRGDATHQRYLTPLHLKYPSNYKSSFELAPDGKGFTIYEKIGDINFREPSYISFEDYQAWRLRKSNEEYFRESSLQSGGAASKGLELNVNIAELSDVFGGGSISIRPTGYATLDFSIDRNRTDNPSIPLRQQRTTTFGFDQQIQLGVVGQIGEKLRMNANFDTQATFQFEDQLKLEHTGTEDQILQKIEAGNVSMQLGNSLIQGRQNLMGLKAKLRFGPVYVTSVASIERGKVESIKVSGGGAIETPFKKEASEYDMNRHFFLSHYFRSKYEEALSDLPVIRSSLRINRVEVWVEQQGIARNNRNAVGFIDLGENDNSVGNGQGRVYNQGLDRSGAYDRLPSNNSNNLFSILTADPAARNQNTAKSAIEAIPGLNMQNTSDFQVLGNMRRLEPNEYTVNTQLGYISLNTPIPPDQVLFVAFDYTLNGQAYQVGEFSNDVPADGLNSNVLFVKMLKSSVLRVEPYPAWDLMMKNIYNIGYGIEQEGFFFDIKYESATSAGKINFLPKSSVANIPLIQVTGLDRLTNHTAPNPDNYFDYIEGITVKSDRGMVIFPVLEPFGESLSRKITDPDDKATYVFQPLYDETQVNAVQRFPELNRYSFEGYYRSASGSEIPLNTFNLQEGSVVVTAGGRTLQEGSDYTVDYSGGKVTILNPSILTSGQDIDVSFESSSAYQIQTKALLGSRIEYSPSRDIRLGATVLNLREQPFNQKTTLGDEPVNNTLWGLDGSFRRESDFLTKVIDRLPLISTKETSSLNLAGEMAQFIPGAPPINKNSEDKGIVYLDDFEAAATPYSLQSQIKWRMASFPEGNTRLLDPTAIWTSPLAANFTRAKLAWYQIDMSFYQRLGAEFPEADLYNNYTRQILPREIFPTASRAFGNNLQPTFDLHYIPNQRGLYNYQYESSRLDPATGLLTEPRENWAGVMREIDVNNDFEATNVEFIEFWMMDPFLQNPAHEGGEFYINLGLVNEDVLTDESLSREHGLPGPNDAPNLQATDWGQISLGNPPNNAFSNQREDREAQDIGLDGLTSPEEATFFEQAVITNLRNILSPNALSEYVTDPSSDDYRHFRDEDYEQRQAGILERYLDFNGTEGNSPVGENTNQYTTQATTLPDNEDLNNNGSLNFAEQYWEYRIRLHPDSMERGKYFIVDKITNDSIRAQNGTQTVTWYQFRVPLNAGKSVNGIDNFKTISYMRMYLAGFEEEVILRMTEFQLVSSQWRKFAGDLTDTDIILPNPEPPFGSFDLGVVGVEDNSQRLPFNYMEPPGIVRQAFNGNTLAGFLEDERALSLKICNLEDGDARGIFKNVRSDLRLYERLRMWVHAEANDGNGVPSNFNETGDARLFIRLGLDNDQNYYEYELPLTPSDPGGGINVAENVWLRANEINFELAKLAAAKDARNTDAAGLIYRYPWRDSTMPEGHFIYVKGTPKLSEVRNIMVGVRNPKDPDGDPICLEVWVNELRMTNFDGQKGWAANANASLKLADIATINGTFSYKTAGFGALDQKLGSRSQEDQIRYDLSANMSLDRFFPKKWGLQLPVYATYGETRINPQFNPQEADVRTDKLLENLDPVDRKLRLQSLQDYRRTRSISFNNWRKINIPKEQPEEPEDGTKAAKPTKQPVLMPWNVSNFDFTFAYNEQLARSAVIERRFTTQHRGAVNYRYTFPQVKVKPFAKFEKIKGLKDFYFSPLPTSVSIAISGDRQFEERLLRATSQFGGSVDPLFSKNFLINRSYTLSWNLTRALQLNYSANNVSRVDEVRGYWSTATDRERDSVGTLGENLLHIGRDPANGHNQLVNFGRTTTFTHNLSAGYQLPFAQIKPLSWISGTVNYTGSFNWQQAPENNQSFGAIIGNSQTIQASGKLDLNGLYRKVAPLKNILEGKKANGQPIRKPGQPATAAPPAKPGQPPVKPPPVAPKDSVEKPDPLRALKAISRELIRIGLSIRSVDVAWNNNASTTLPGYLPMTDNFGFDWGYINPTTGVASPLTPPTLGFLFGDQRDIRYQAGLNGWITQDTLLSNLFMRNNTSNLTARTSVELFKGFRVELSANRSINANESEFYRYDPQTEGFRGFDPLSSGNFSMTYIFINTAFEFGNPEESENFRNFSSIRQQISSRYAEKNPETRGNVNDIVTGGYRNGYLGTNQDVLITSMLASYGLVAADKVSLTAFPAIPLPNWNVNYNGLTNLPFLKKYFSAVTLKHGYRATYTVGNFNNNLTAQDLDGNGIADNFTSTTDPLGNEIRDYYALDNIQGVQISEQFSPLIGINVNTKKGLTSQFDYKRGRNLTLNVGSMQMTESRNEDVSLMIGYRKDKVNMDFRFMGRDISLKNSMNAQLRTTIRDTRDVQHTLAATATDPSQSSVTTRGSLSVIVSPSVDYVVNTRVNAKLFYEININRPRAAASAYNTSFSSAGVQIRFTLTN